MQAKVSLYLQLTSCLTGLNSTKLVNMLLIHISKAAEFKQVKQEVSCTVIPSLYSVSGYSLPYSKARSSSKLFVVLFVLWSEWKVEHQLGGQISEPLHSFSLYIPLVKCTLHKSMKNVSERMIHASCVWSMQLWQKVVVQKISKFPISVETQLSSTAPFIKCSLCEKSLKGKQFALQLGGLSDKTLWICKLQCCICCQILIINLNINWEKVRNLWAN